MTTIAAPAAQTTRIAEANQQAPQRASQFDTSQAALSKLSDTELKSLFDDVTKSFRALALNRRAKTPEEKAKILALSQNRLDIMAEMGDRVGTGLPIPPAFRRPPITHGGEMNPANRPSPRRGISPHGDA